MEEEATAIPQRHRIRQVAEALNARPDAVHRAVVGFDGFVDEIVHVIRTRHAPDAYERIATISEFADRIGAAAGLSTNLELVTVETKLGGNGPIMANALVALGVGASYLGSVGYPDVHPMFQAFASACEVTPLAPPGHTLACEFDDGKIMLGRTTSLADVTWDRIVASIPEAALAETLGQCSLFAAVNWTMLPHIAEAWRRILELFPFPRGGAGPISFFDLADPQKRDPEDLREALEIIEQFRSRSRCILGLNRKEATEVASALGIEASGGNARASLADITEAIGQALDVHAVVVHPAQEAAAYADGRLVFATGPYTSKPRLTTGAGDNFNAGFCYAQMRGLDLEASLIAGKGVSGFYVRHGRSPALSELVDFLHAWADQFGSDF